MKKLLLVSLLALGATVFAGVAGEQKKVSMPISAIGEILADSDDSLVIDSPTNGINGGKMEFDFKQMTTPKSGKTTKELTNTFTITRGNDTDLLSASEKLYVGFKGAFTAADENTATSTPTTGVTINYALGADIANTGEVSGVAVGTKVFNGEIKATASVATGATAGNFADNTQKLYIEIKQ